LEREEPLPEGAKLYIPDNLISQGAASEPQPFTFEGKTYEPPPNSHWKANYPEGMKRLATARRIHVSENTLRYVRLSTDFPWRDLNNVWTDTLTGQFTEPKRYVVQTNTNSGSGLSILNFSTS
jgi:adenine-specific DNA-methyltransferase